MPPVHDLVQVPFAVEDGEVVALAETMRTGAATGACQDRCDVVMDALAQSEAVPGPAAATMSRAPRRPASPGECV